MSRFLPRSKSYLNLLLLAGTLVIFVGIPLTVFLTQKSDQNARNPKAATTFTNTVDQLIAQRGDHMLQHEIAVPSPMDSWSWGQHGTEDTKFKQPDSGTVAPWLVVYPDASQFTAPPNVRYNIRRIALWNHQPSNNQWVKIYDGLPHWWVNTPDTGGGYVNISPTTEADGTYSFGFTANMALHMAAGNWPQISEGDGIVSVVEARLLGASADVVAAKIGCASGADYRNAAGDMSQGWATTGFHQSGFGQIGLLTADWKAFDMLSSTLTDAQVRANPPPGFTTSTPIDNPPTVSITSPANVSVVNSGTTVSISATATDTDSTPVANVQFSVDGVVKATITIAPYTYNWNTTGLTGSHTITAVATDTANLSSGLATVTITVNSSPPVPLPVPWVTSDIGSVGLAGSASYTSGVFTVAGSGADIWDVADSFRYVYQDLNGDGTIVARVTSQTNTDPWAKAGVTIRQDTTAGSAQALLGVTPGNGLAFQYRATAGGTTSSVAAGAYSFPIWLKLQKSGSNITAYTSTNGTTYTQVGTTTISFTNLFKVGLAVLSHNNSLLSQALFDNVKVSAISVSVKVGDLNGDNLVNGADLAILLSRWGSTDPVADINKSGKVDSADLALLLAHWGS